jgi:hypothetical protein
MLEREYTATGRRLEEYWEMQKHLSPDATHEVLHLIDQLRILERGILKAAGRLKHEMRYPDCPVA